MTPWLFVDGFPPAVTTDQLRKAFAQVGTVRHAVIVQGSQRRVAFIEMATIADAKEALRALHGLELEGTPLRVLWTGQPPQSKE